MKNIGRLGMSWLRINVPLSIKDRKEEEEVFKVRVREPEDRKKLLSFMALDLFASFYDFIGQYCTLIIMQSCPKPFLIVSLLFLFIHWPYS